MEHTKKKLDDLSIDSSGHIKDEDNEIRELRKEFLEKIDLLIEAQNKTNADVAGLVEAWNTAGSLIRFMKWLSGIAVSMTILWELIKGKL